MKREKKGKASTGAGTKKHSRENSSQVLGVEGKYGVDRGCTAETRK